LEDQRKHLVPHIEIGRVSSKLQRQKQSAGDPRLSIGGGKGTSKSPEVL
jgi:hypothetical protein